MAMTINEAGTEVLKVSWYLPRPIYLLFSRIWQHKKDGPFTATRGHTYAGLQYWYSTNIRVHKNLHGSQNAFMKTKANCYLSGGNVLLFVRNKRMLDWSSGFLFRWILTVNCTCTEKQTHCHNVSKKRIRYGFDRHTVETNIYQTTVYQRKPT